MRKLHIRLNKIVIRHRISLLAIALFFVTLAVVLTYRQILFPGGWGVGNSQSVTTKIVIDSAAGTRETSIVHSNGKTVWDWLNLLGVPLSLACLGAWFQSSQQRQAAKIAKAQKEQAAAVADEQRKRLETAAKEEVLQGYFDRISVLLVDKTLLSVVAKSEAECGSSLLPSQKKLTENSGHIVRARTLSALRRFDGDGERKASIIRFLIETKIINELDLSGADLRNIILNGDDLSKTNLSGADLSSASLHQSVLNKITLKHACLYKADLSMTHLVEANLHWARLHEVSFSGADLTEANLMDAVLSGANLTNAYFFKAKLSRAKLHRADLCVANLTGAYLNEARLTYTNCMLADFTDANLCGADLTGADLSGAKLSTALFAGVNLKDIKYDEDTLWPKEKLFLATCKNIPKTLQQRLTL